MTTFERNKLLKNNTLCWLAAIALPAILHFALSSTKFPWPIIVPLLLIGPMLASNKMLAKAIGDTTDDPPTSTMSTNLHEFTIAAAQSSSVKGEIARAPVFGSHGELRVGNGRLSDGGKKRDLG